MYTNSHSVDDPVPGDLVFFENTYRDREFTCSGIYLGDGKFIHAGTKKVEITAIDPPIGKINLSASPAFHNSKQLDNKHLDQETHALYSLGLF